MRSDDVTLSAGDEMTAPFTDTRPAAIQISASRREASPARAITLAIRSPGVCEGVLSDMSEFFVGAGLAPAIHAFLPERV
jgi:hypothetical protein